MEILVDDTNYLEYFLTSMSASNKILISVVIGLIIGIVLFLLKKTIKIAIIAVVVWVVISYTSLSITDIADWFKGHVRNVAEITADVVESVSESAETVFSSEE